MARFLKIVVNIILLTAIVIAGALLIPIATGTTTVMVDSTEMVTTLPLGSVTYAKKVNASELKVGDLVVKEDNLGNNVYEIVNADTASGSFELKDKYDESSETRTATLRNSVSKVVLTVPYIAYVVMAMQSIEGIIIIALIVIFVVILFILSELWKKSDEEELENEDDEEYEELDEEPVKSKSQLKRERKEQKKLDKQRAKEYAKAEKLARKNGGAVEDYLENTPLFEEEKPMEEEQSNSNVVSGAPFELPKIDISSVTDAEELENIQEETQDEEESESIQEEQEKQKEHTESADDIMAALASELAQSVGKVKEETKETIEEADWVEEDPEEEIEEEIEEAEESQEELQQTREVVLEEVVEDKNAPKKMVIPKYSAKELIDKAEAEGDKPEIIEEKDLGITLLDYSNIIK